MGGRKSKIKKKFYPKQNLGKNFFWSYSYSNFPCSQYFIPVEIFLIIFQYLPIKTVFSCVSSICRHFNEIVNSKIFWKEYTNIKTNHPRSLFISELFEKRFKSKYTVYPFDNIGSYKKVRVILLTGNLGTGKTSLRKALINQNFDENEPSTSLLNEGLKPTFDFFLIDINKQVKLWLCDDLILPGSTFLGKNYSHSNSLNPSFVLFLFSLDCLDSLNFIEGILIHYLETENTGDTLFELKDLIDNSMLVGTKCDLVDQRKQGKNKEKIKSFVEKWKFPVYIECILIFFPLNFQRFIKKEYKYKIDIL